MEHGKCIVYDAPYIVHHDCCAVHPVQWVYHALSALHCITHSVQCKLWVFWIVLGA